MANLSLLFCPRDIITWNCVVDIDSEHLSIFVAKVFLCLNLNNHGRTTSRTLRCVHK